jgi:phosphoserine aminotransferase
MQKPQTKPLNPCFSSGPCAKRPGWNINNLKNVAVGRSHRSKICKEKLNKVITLTKKLLNIPDDYLVGIVPASDTGAVEMAMWNLLGERGVDVFSWESFSKDWATDATEQLKLDDLRVFHADYGLLPDFSQSNSERDIVFTYNGTTSGVKVANCDWISDNRKGLTICDATSAIFAMELDWSKLDATTFSWQKTMGSEAAHGMIILSPKAIERLENYQPNRPIPKIFRLTNKAKLIKGIFSGATINTPSMLAVEDALDSLNWIESIGGNNGIINRSNGNLKVISNWVAKSEWIDFLASNKDTISNSSICLKITNSDYLNLLPETQASLVKELLSFLEKEQIAYDIASYRDAPLGIRIWGGGTVSSEDIDILTQWLDYGFATILPHYLKAA